MRAAGAILAILLSLFAVPASSKGSSRPVPVKLKDGTLKTPDMEDPPSIPTNPFPRVTPPPEPPVVSLPPQDSSSQGSVGSMGSDTTPSHVASPPEMPVISAEPSPVAVPVMLVY